MAPPPKKRKSLDDLKKEMEMVSKLRVFLRVGMRDGRIQVDIELPGS